MEPNLGGRISGLDVRLANYVAEKKALQKKLASSAVPPEKKERCRQRLSHLEATVIPRTVHELQVSPH
ncbi:MAG: hypothetical protein A2842_02755 [Candidatus Wildermuthbacteria bacterium RIFCSPHIGHO2_01_FULL_48_25]|uniref:Uncharacterized protein n=1 Tax=Candidatus Wildermuthbacteria bacterium RIFCSPLOWO2_01_FULL_48_16 TaxID=1802461 RepID=A0A1G2RLY4_9BACT|nr:MAG: hypothetical protein A2842_02755 [Candidatus Wildermuthbacteria bacterium RIFCSPHIGHO2_01_FULL_48_25]OHA68175.1 MAG: hypothetical protein A3J57_02120 [Candidatus Wildermuthbacteria bacterium RIFCSPHIGHO2_02_FULL_49_12b]OHA73021.1 MAG: hypothetical protein A3B24_01240 [Candidatus Wildermuthbacteria bacterium RIFCSPLOWO2_01_FULL_48_16]